MELEKSDGLLALLCLPDRDDDLRLGAPVALEPSIEVRGGVRRDRARDFDGAHEPDDRRGKDFGMGTNLFEVTGLERPVEAPEAERPGAPPCTPASAAQPVWRRGT